MQRQVPFSDAAGARVASEPSELAAIYAAHFDPVWHHLRRMGIAAADREDLTQEVFLVVHRRLAVFDRARPLRPWLIGIATRVALSYWRTARRRPGDVASASDPEADTAGAAGPDHDARQLLAALLATLDPEQRVMFVLHELEGFSVPEIAKLSEVPLNTVYSRLRRIREDLAELAQRWQNQEAP
jgi:RNA polymerase sigma-70 factor (ECF subfamily)